MHKLAPDDVPRLHYGLPKHGIEIAFHPMDFTQVNQAINRKLVDLVIDLLRLDPSQTVLDLFCGIGNFTLPIARRAGRIHGIELSPESVARARENAESNDVPNATFETGDLFDSVRLPATCRIECSSIRPEAVLRPSAAHLHSARSKG
ncbi:MAG: methyltransferase domain-containing protein [Gammaproteobacteria bacterium]|nr:methyltransferase domain-containing protein [Gammaproteobacteria bacterium]